ncbi:unnamed protein product [Rotaria socialis]|uniref:C2 domain-containing protein n=1 Tax=Rotaria socialis TaxID=392032 RepID=A0A818LDI2_9BILA|nr:unnamed protein product [Rotaria socialis]CAF3477966.1 unnamed protein product [Rotaria socialis]CAF3509882.1 unnamed protein product [Rotaria socialis]CAF3575598.1 unnamed protein product [Rotaria socialis]CAF4288566.1 unnamed protein product [Rotaria socialis]
MDRLENITEFVVVSNLENRVLNAAISKGQDWWKHRRDHNQPNQPNQPNQSNQPNQPNQPNQSNQPNQGNVPQSIPQTSAPTPIVGVPGYLTITILRAEDLREPPLSMIKASISSSDRPYVIVECNQQRFQTLQADSNSSNRHPQWTSGNGPFGFNIFNPYTDHLTVWVQGQDPLRIIKNDKVKILGMCEMNVSRLIGEKQMWLPLRDGNKPAGQLLLQCVFRPSERPPPPYNNYYEF